MERSGVMVTYLDALCFWKHFTYFKRNGWFWLLLSDPNKIWVLWIFKSGGLNHCCRIERNVPGVPWSRSLESGSNTYARTYIIFFCNQPNSGFQEKSKLFDGDGCDWRFVFHLRRDSRPRGRERRRVDAAAENCRDSNAKREASAKQNVACSVSKQENYPIIQLHNKAPKKIIQLWGSSIFV